MLYEVITHDATKTKEEFHHPGGLAEYLVKLVAERGKPAIHPEPFALELDTGHTVLWAVEAQPRATRPLTVV